MSTKAESRRNRSLKTFTLKPILDWIGEREKQNEEELTSKKRKPFQRKNRERERKERKAILPPLIA